MIFHATELEGIVIIEPERIEDERGSFSRTWCAQEFVENGLADRFAQCSTSFNRRRGTLRGMHYQQAPWGEAKLVRCTQGRIFDVVLDLRPGSPTLGRWIAAELSAELGHMIYIPDGFAHGFQTLEDGCEVYYQITEPYRPSAGRGVRWNDPVIGIEWPLADPIMSHRDKALPLLGEAVPTLLQGAA